MIVIDFFSKNMRQLLALAVLLSFLFSACRKESPSLEETHLIQKLPYAKKSPDLWALFFGTVQAQPHLISGWSVPEREGVVPFQWAAARTAAFSFEADSAEKRFLHLRLRSFFSNSAKVLLNSRPVSEVEIPRQPHDFTIPLPAEILVHGTNRVELQFAETRYPGNPEDSRTLAAAAYFALISRSEYIEEEKIVPRLDPFVHVEHLRLSAKKIPAVLMNTGGSLYFYERLDPNSVLRFGYYFQPEGFVEEDDFAVFSVLLRKEGEKQESIFSKQVEKGAREFVQLSLNEFLREESSSIYEIEFSLVRNSILNKTRTAWLDPVLSTATPVRAQKEGSLRELEGIRRANRNANVIVIVLDATSVRHVGCYGYSRKTTPILDQLAAKNLQFQRAYSDAVYTLASTGTLLTGWMPEHHQVLYLKSKLPEENVTLAEVFRAAGYETGTFVANGNASGTFGMTQGFRKIREVFRDRKYTGWGQDVTNAFLQWLAENYGRKFFVYLHYREPHDPFNPPKEWIQKFADPKYSGPIGRTFEQRIKINTNAEDLVPEDRSRIIDLYDANLAYGDSQVGQILDELRRLGVYDRTVVIATSDHGEAFWEHGYQGHNSQLYEESMRIPLIIKFAPGIGARKISQTVRTVDLFPTLLDLMSLSHRKMVLDGTSFLPYVVSAHDDGRPVFSQTTLQRQHAYLDGHHKYIVDFVGGADELYDLQKDPGEQKNLLGDRPILAAFLRAQLMERRDGFRKAAEGRKIEQAVIDESARENLKALGYLDHE